MTEKELFQFVSAQVNHLAREETRPPYMAFVQWFVQLYSLNARDMFFSDGRGDGKVDMFFKTDDGRSVHHYIINSKFTQEYGKKAGGAYYDEVSRFCTPFVHKEDRAEFLATRVGKDELRKRYRLLFERFDEGEATLIFLTNCKKNEAQVTSLETLPVKHFHFEDIQQFVLDDMDGAMPRTAPLTLHEVRDVISPDLDETSIRTAIVFARLIDFVEYMEEDPHDLLFARNVRLDLGNTPVNKAIKDTFRNAPNEFAYSNNGITLLCEDYNHGASTELILKNPRVVNGSQTLHSIRSVKNPSEEARVMVRIIKIPPASGKEVRDLREKRKKIINNISIRSNQQNPIKSWDLVANDDFNLGLFRYFRIKDFFYERRKGEWSHRSRALRTSGMMQGPKLKKMVQLIAASRLGDKDVGAWKARSNTSELFDGGAYNKISQTPTSEVYSLFLLQRLISKNLPSSATYENKLRGYIDLPLFGLLCELIRRAQLNFSELALQTRPERQKAVADLVNTCVKFIYDNFRREAEKYKKAEGKILTIANYFKNESYESRLVESKIPHALIRATKVLFSAKS